MSLAAKMATERGDALATLRLSPEIEKRQPEISAVPFFLNMERRGSSCALGVKESCFHRHAAEASFF